MVLEINKILVLLIKQTLIVTVLVMILQLIVQEIMIIILEIKVDLFYYQKENYVSIHYHFVNF